MKKDNVDIRTSLIFAMAENRCIGKNNQMPWHIPEDLKRFKTLTMEHPVIMGRRTFESILGYLKKPLPGRESIIVTRNPQTLYPDTPILQTGTIEQAIEIGHTIAKDKGLDEIFIIGGAQIYTQSLAFANRLYITKVHREIAGDAFFPAIDDTDWEESECLSHEDHDPPYSFVTLERRQQNLL